MNVLLLCFQFIVSDFDKLDDEINDTRRMMKQKLSKLRDIEKKDNLKGFDLQPLTPEELNAINSVL